MLKTTLCLQPSSFLFSKRKWSLIRGAEYVNGAPEDRTIGLIQKNQLVLYTNWPSSFLNL